MQNSKKVEELQESQKFRSANIVPPPPLVPFQKSTFSQRIYRNGYRNRKSFEKKEQEYVISRILNQQDYHAVRSTLCAPPLSLSSNKTHNQIQPKPYQLPQQAPYNKSVILTKQQPFRNSFSRTSYNDRTKGGGAETSRSSRENSESKRMRLYELDNIRYVRYRVDPYILNPISPLRKYKKECCLENRFDFLTKSDSYLLQ